MAGRALALIAFLLVAAVPAGADAKTAAQEAKAREKIARLWADLARDAFERGYPEEGQDALRRAREAGLADAEVAEIEGLGRVAGGAGPSVEEAGGGPSPAPAPSAAPEPPPAPDSAFLERKSKVQKEAAKSWDRLSDLFEKEGNDPRFSTYLLEAIALDPTKSRIARLAEAAMRQPILVRGPSHPMVAWLSLPSGWKSGREYPVLVTVEGAGANFLGNHNGFRGARGSREVILLSPYALSCTNDLKTDKFPHYPQGLLEEHAAQVKRVEFDVAGMEALLDLLSARLGAAPRVAITGFSGGGFLCYGLAMRRPARVALCAPACANFLPAIGEGQPAAEGEAPIVRIFTGEKDQHRDHVFGQAPGIEGQSDWAVESFGRLGMKDLRRTMLPGVGHSSCVAQVWEAFDEVLGRTK